MSPLVTRKSTLDWWSTHATSTPTHFGIAVRPFLYDVFLSRWTGHTAVVKCPPRSLDFTPLDYVLRVNGPIYNIPLDFFWNRLKWCVYVDRPHTMEELQARIRAEIRLLSVDIVERRIQSVYVWLGQCQLVVNGLEFEYLDV